MIGQNVAKKRTKERGGKKATKKIKGKNRNSSEEINNKKIKLKEGKKGIR